MDVVASNDVVVSANVNSGMDVMEILDVDEAARVWSDGDGTNAMADPMKARQMRRYVLGYVDMVAV